MAAQDVVKNVIRWQVGNGCCIQIWKDKWLPTSPSHRVVSSPSTLPPDATVASLIDVEEGAWKEEVFQSLFLPHEAEVIQGIALSSKLLEDRQVWAPTANGHFNVKSAYKLVVEMNIGAAYGVVSNDINFRKFWKYIWKVNVPYKVHHFTWRACNNILPTKDNLVRRKVLSDSCCDECKAKVESSGHLFWACPRTRDIWALANLTPLNPNLHFNSFLDLLWYAIMIAKWEQDMVEKIIMISWMLWTNRNEVRNGGVKKSGQAVIHGALNYLGEYQSGQAVKIM